MKAITVMFAITGCLLAGTVAAATEAEAMEVCAAFIQLYREQAWYLERTAPWIERVGLAHVQSALFDDPDAVATLAARFHHSQQFMQDDPWAKRVAGEDAELHQHLAEVRPLQLETVQ